MATRKPAAPVKKAPAKKAAARMAAAPPPEVLSENDIPSTPPEVETTPPAETPVSEPHDLPTSPPPPAPPIDRVDKEQILTLAEDIIDTLTFKRVALIALLTGIALLLFSLYENRSKIVETVVTPKPEPSLIEDVPQWQLSPTSRAELERLTNTTAVGFVVVSDVDLKKNRRAAKYSFLEDKTILLSPQQQQALALPMPVFDYDAKNTAQMVSVLSNEFRCDPYRETLYFRYAPELADRFSTVCRISIPPFAGQFAGFLTVAIEGTPQKSDLDSIRLEVSRIAVDIFYNDIQKRPVPVLSNS